MNLLAADGLLADGTNVSPGESGAQSFLSGTTAGQFLVAACGILAVVIMIVCVLKMIKGISASRPGDAAKALVFGLVIGALLINLNLTIKGVNMAGGLVEKVFDSIPSIGGGGEEQSV